MLLDERADQARIDLAAREPTVDVVVQRHEPHESRRRERQAPLVVVRRAVAFGDATRVQAAKALVGALQRPAQAPRKAKRHVLTRSGMRRRGYLVLIRSRGAILAAH